MKKTLLIFLLAIPFISQGQSLNGTAWKITHYSAIDRHEIFLFEKDGTLTSMAIDDSPEWGVVYSKDNNTWEINGDKVTISFGDGFLIYKGIITRYGEFMYGDWVTQRKPIDPWPVSGEWRGNLIKF